MDYDTRRCLERRIETRCMSGVWYWSAKGLAIPQSGAPNELAALKAGVDWIDENCPDLVAQATDRARYINSLFGPLTEDRDPL